MKWAIGTVVLVLILLVGGIFAANQVWAPEGSSTQFAREFVGVTEDTAKPSPLVEVYKGISVSQNIKTVDLSGKNLDGSLMAEVRNLTQLQELNLSRNNFTGLPAEVGQLSELRVLNLSNNDFTGLPQELGNLQKLEELNLAGNNVSEFDLNIIRERLPDTTVIVTESEQVDSIGSGPAGVGNEEVPVACTMDAKVCPDGSAVGRVGPDCEFAPCPI